MQIVSAAKPFISVSLVEALNGKEAYGVKGKPYSQKGAVREIVDARYPAFASGERGRSKVS